KRCIILENQQKLVLSILNNYTTKLKTQN
ncbi:uncharacterized protein METZ01_LOCUS142040, partial [marine metagenome]